MVAKNLGCRLLLDLIVKEFKDKGKISNKLEAFSMTEEYYLLELMIEFY